MTKEHLTSYTCNACGNEWDENPKTVEGCPACASYDISIAQKSED